MFYKYFRRGSLAITLSVFATSCFQIFDSGPNKILKESYNREQSKKAILFLKGGNATTDNSLQVTISDYDYELDKTEVGNTLTTDTDHNKTNLDSASVNFKWISNDTILLDYDKNLRIFLRNEIVNGVYVKYLSR
jgi:hypothetical protein